MIKYEEEIVELIKPLFDDYGLELKKASKEEINNFEEEARNNGVSSTVITELKRFYSVTDGIDPSLDSLWICKLGDSIKYEFWKEQKQLWIGQRDMDLLSWKDERFHLGCARELNYGEEYIFENLLELLKKGFKDWYPATNGKYPIE